MLSIDFIPIPVDEANKDVDNILLGVQSDKANFNRRQAQNQNYGATNYDLEQREKEILKSETICVTVTKEFMTR